jgi:hypothetical protein
MADGIKKSGLGYGCRTNGDPAVCSELRKAASGMRSRQLMRVASLVRPLAPRGVVEIGASGAVLASLPPTTLGVINDELELRWE